MNEKETIKELERLSNLYHERKAEFDKASRIRWILAFVGFVLVFFFILIKGDTKSLFKALFSADIEQIKNILLLLLAGMVVTGFHFFINISVFGWLFQKDIAENRRLDSIEQQIRELEKHLKVVMSEKTNN